MLTCEYAQKDAAADLDLDPPTLSRIDPEIPDSSGLKLQILRPKSFQDLFPMESFCHWLI